MSQELKVRLPHGYKLVRVEDEDEDKGPERYHAPDRYRIFVEIGMCGMWPHDEAVKMANHHHDCIEKNARRTERDLIAMRFKAKILECIEVAMRIHDTEQRIQALEIQRQRMQDHDWISQGSYPDENGQWRSR